MASGFAGGAPTRCAWFLALGFLFSTAGCAHKAAPGAPRRFVRVNALLPFHPDWGSMTAMSSVDAAMGAARAEALHLSVPPSPLPQPFPSPSGTPESLESSRRRHVAADAARRIEALRANLVRHNAEVIRRERSAAEKELQAREALARADLVASLPAKSAELNRYYDLLIRDLKYKEVDYLTQTRVYSDAPLIESRKKLAAARARIAALEIEKAAKATQVRSDLIKQQDAQISLWRRELEDRIATREAEIQKLVSAQIDRAVSTLKAETDPIPAPGAESVSGPTAREPARPADASSAAPAEFAAARAETEQGLASRIGPVSARRAALLEAICGDILRSSERVAARKGWILVPEGSHDADDATEEVRVALISDWRERARLSGR